MFVLGLRCSNVSLASSSFTKVYLTASFSHHMSGSNVFLVSLGRTKSTLSFFKNQDQPPHIMAFVSFHVPHKRFLCVKTPNKFFSFSYSHQADTAQVVCRVYATAGIKYWRDTSSCSRIRWRTLWWTISVGQRGPCQLNEEIVSSFTKYCKVSLTIHNTILVWKDPFIRRDCCFQYYYQCR